MNNDSHFVSNLLITEREQTFRTLESMVDSRSSDFEVMKLLVERAASLHSALDVLRRGNEASSLAKDAGAFLEWFREFIGSETYEEINAPALIDFVATLKRIKGRA